MFIFPLAVTGQLPQDNLLSRQDAFSSDQLVPFEDSRPPCEDNSPLQDDRGEGGPPLGGRTSVLEDWSSFLEGGSLGVELYTIHSCYA